MELLRQANPILLQESHPLNPMKLAFPSSWLFTLFQSATPCGPVWDVVSLSQVVNICDH